MNNTSLGTHLGRFIALTYLFIAVSVFKYRHEGETDIDIIKNFDSVIFFQETVIENKGVTSE